MGASHVLHVYQTSLRFGAHLSRLCVLIILCTCPHAALCVLILLQMCPHTAIFCICVLIMLCMCPHTAMYVSSYCYMCPHTAIYMCPHTATYVSSYCYLCVRILLHMCPHIATYVLILLQMWFGTDLSRYYCIDETDETNKEHVRHNKTLSFLLFVVLERANSFKKNKNKKNAGQCYEKLGMLPEAEAHIRDASRCMRPYVSSVCGLTLLVYEALRQRLTCETLAGSSKRQSATRAPSQPTPLGYVCVCVCVRACVVCGWVGVLCVCVC